MRLVFAVLSFALLPSFALAHKAPREVDPAYLATLHNTGSILPRGLAPFETVPRYLRPVVPAEAPSGFVRAIAEYEPTEGILITWGGYDALHTEMVVPLTTADPPSDVWIVVDTSSERNAATSVLTNGGANIAHVHFITAATDSVWMRDYGPRFVTHRGTRAIIDHVYNRPRPHDDDIPGVIGADWSEDVYELPLVHGGGNFHLFRDREAFMTRLVVNENPGVSEAEIVADFHDYEGLDVTLFDPFPQSYDSTQHIDMWMLPLADSKVLIGQYQQSQGGGIPKSVTDAAASELASRGYTVYRTPGWNTFGTHYTYANSVIVNQVALICRFDGYETENAQALATYRQALPDSDVVQVDCSDIISLSGAIHCIVMHVPVVVPRGLRPSDPADPPGLVAPKKPAIRS